jgi:hypothetical protein
MLHPWPVLGHVHALLLRVHVFLEQRLGTRALTGFRRIGDGVVLPVCMMQEIVDLFCRYWIPTGPKRSKSIGGLTSMGSL